MNALKPNTSFRHLLFIVAALVCLNSAQAHPGHEHDGGFMHVALHAGGLLAGVALVIAMGWAIARVRARRSTQK